MQSTLLSPRCWLFLLVAASLVAGGCGGDNIPRTKREIQGDIESLPALYRTTSGIELEAPGNAGEGGSVFVDHNTGELAWRVWECHNPDCPDRPATGPTLFICPDPDLSANPDGTINYEQTAIVDDQGRATVLPSKTEPALYCPACARERNFAAESDAQRQHYMDFITPHVLPETAAMQEQLEAEIQVRQEHVQERMQENSAP